MATRPIGWFENDWPLDSKIEIPHHALEDLRKMCWLMINNMYANATDAADLTPTFDDVMTAYGTAPDGSKAPSYGPGSITCYFEGKWDAAHALQGVSNNELIFTHSAAAEDDFQKGCPFKITGSTDNANDGFHRVRSTRVDGGNLYVTVDDEEYTQKELIDQGSAEGSADCDFGGDWYTLRGTNGSAHIATADTQMANDYNAAVVPDVNYYDTCSGRWLTNDDLIHAYAGGARGDGDKRPPDGGKFSCDLNDYWIRTPNPNLYHHSDVNSHRYLVHSDHTGSFNPYAPNLSDFEGFSCLIPSHGNSLAQADPKEMVPPFYYQDTNANRWKYGSKVEVLKSQISNQEYQGAIINTIETGYNAWTQGASSNSIDKQYYSAYSTDQGGISYGYEPPNSKYNPSANNQRTQNVQNKFDPALQVMIEYALESLDWMLEVDTTYKTNWVMINYYAECTHDTQYPKRTYGQVYTQNGLSAAYNPRFNVSQPFYASMQDEEWGCNGSTFEKILEILGTDYYDWHFDTAHPWTPKRILDARWEWKYSHTEQSFHEQYGDDVNVGGFLCNSWEEAQDAMWPKPQGTWRRVWKRSFGLKEAGRMRSSSRTEPTGYTYKGNASWAGYLPYDIHWCGIYAGNETQYPSEPPPAESMFYDISYTVSTTAGSRTFEITGDKTNKAVRGRTLYVHAGTDQGESYVIHGSTYDSGTNKTTVTLVSAVTSTDTQTFGFDESVSDYRDPVFRVNTTDVWDNIISLLNDCYTILTTPEYYGVETEFSIIAKNHLCSDSPTSWPTTTDFDSPEEMMEFIRASFNQVEETDIDAWISSGTAIGGSFYAAHVIGTESTYRMSNWFRIRVAGIEWTADIPPFVDALEYYVRLKVTLLAYQDATPESQLNGEMPADGCYRNFIGLNGSDLQLWTRQYPNHNEWAYGWARVEPALDANSKNKARLITRSVELPMNLTGTSYDLLVTNNQGAVGVAGDFMIHKVNWDYYDDGIWDRDNTRADYKLTDSRQDTNPPVVEPLVYVVEPTMYDYNMSQDGGNNGTTWLYDNPDYTPEWRLKGRSILMEDLEDNGVLYRFNFAHATYPTEADKMDVDPQEARYFDKVLDMDVGDDPGDSDDAWAAYDALVYAWDVYLKCRDNASVQPGNDSDNLCPSSPSANITFDTPMFPMKARWTTVDITSPKMINVGGLIYDWLALDVPIATGALAYQFWANDPVGGWIDVTSELVSAPVGAPSKYTKPNMFWRENFSGAGREYRARILHADGNGQYSESSYNS